MNILSSLSLYHDNGNYKLLNVLRFHQHKLQGKTADWLLNFVRRQVGHFTLDYSENQIDIMILVLTVTFEELILRKLK